MNRRELLKLSALASVLLLSGCTKIIPEPIIRFIEIEPDHKVLMQESESERVVIVGGGWAGLSMAKNMKKIAPNMDVILLEQRSQFFSLAVSNLWLVGAIDMEYLIHDYLQAARENNYVYINTTVIDVDKSDQQVITTHGALDYDYLVLAPGIEYDYSDWTLDNRYARQLQTLYPAGFLSSSEVLSIRNKIFDFQVGVFLMNVPSGNYRSWAAPYERALLMADFFKKEGRDVKIILIDENKNIRSHEDTIKALFENEFADIIEYHPDTRIQSIDIENKKIIIEGEVEFNFDDAIFYPKVKSTALLEKIGLLDGSGDANIEPLTNESLDDDNVFVIGDARSMNFNRLGSTALSEAKHLSKRILYRSMGEEYLWTSPSSISFCALSIDPLRVVTLQGRYNYELLENRFNFIEKKIKTKKRTNEDDNSLFEWATGAFDELFKA
ncbi:MAG: FAD/NAD(P)-binding oxidoreductase [Campylobacterota bacterium]|nr:FAD/NAD(P)-binding oxidoreductase [Campylobacterota bacterium]